MPSIPGATFLCGTSRFQEEPDTSILAPTYFLNFAVPLHIARVAYYGAISAFFEGEVVPETVCDRKPTGGRHRSALGTLCGHFCVEKRRREEKNGGKVLLCIFPPIRT